MPKTTTYPESIQKLIDHNVDVTLVKGGNGRRIFVCESAWAEPTNMVAKVTVYVIDTDDTEPWVSCWGPTVASVDPMLRMLK